MRLTKTQEEILKLLLANFEENYSIRSIAKALNKSYTLTYNNIQRLLKIGMLEMHVLPPAHMISLNERAPTEILITIEMKRTYDFLKKHSWAQLYGEDVLSSSNTPFFVLLVFGSYAKGTQTKNSDIDILMIVPTKEQIKNFERAGQQYTKVRKSIIIVDVASFVEMIKSPKVLNVGNEATKNHVILYGVEQYYQIIKS